MFRHTDVVNVGLSFYLLGEHVRVAYTYTISTRDLSDICPSPRAAGLKEQAYIRQIPHGCGIATVLHNL